MSKKLIIVITVIILLAVTTFLTNDNFDRFNPFLQEEKSYAIVKQHTQQYNDVTAYSKNGEKILDKLLACLNDNKIIIIATHDTDVAKKCNVVVNMEDLNC